MCTIILEVPIMLSMYYTLCKKSPYNIRIRYCNLYLTNTGTRYFLPITVIYICLQGK